MYWSAVICLPSYAWYHLSVGKNNNNNNNNHQNVYIPTFFSIYESINSVRSLFVKWERTLPYLLQRQLASLVVVHSKFIDNGKYFQNPSCSGLIERSICWQLIVDNCSLSNCRVRNVGHRHCWSTLCVLMSASLTDVSMSCSGSNTLPP